MLKLKYNNNQQNFKLILGCLLVLDEILFSCMFVAAGNESCPQPQTSEHLAAIEIMKLKHIIILQNKIDLVKETQAQDQHEQIQAFVQGKKRGNIGISV